MKKRMLSIVLLMSILASASAYAVVQGTSTGITRQIYMPTEENIHFERQENLTLVSMQRIAAIEQSISSLQDEIGALRSTAENQRKDFSTQLGGINRELNEIKKSINELQVIKQQLLEIRPQLEKPQAIVPPVSLLILGAANMLLLIVVIVLIFWLKGQHAALQKESHLEEHSLIHLTSYILEAMNKGISMQTIRKRLRDKGWSESMINEAVQEARSVKS